MGFFDLLAKVDRSVRTTLGEAVTYAPLAGAPFEVQGIFDAAYVKVDVGEAGVASSGPAVFLSLHDLAPYDPTQDDRPTLTIRGESFTVKEPQPDGAGGVLLLLYRA